MITIRDFLAALPSLHPAERAMIRKAIDALGTRDPVEPPKQVEKTEKIARQDLTADEQRLLNTLRHFMLKKGAEVVIMTQLRTDEEFRTKCAALWEYIRKVTSIRLEQVAILSLGWDLLYKDMQEHDFKHDELRTLRTAHALLLRIDRIPALINRAFPGYANAGVLHWIFKRDADHVREQQSRPPGPPRRRSTGGQ